MARRAFVWLVTTTAVLAVAWQAGRMERRQAAATVTLFSAQQRGCAIVVPDDVSSEERRAAELLQSTLAKAAGRLPEDFPIRREGGGVDGPGILLGATRRGGDFMRALRPPPFDTAVGSRIRGGWVQLRSERREAVESAVAWFLERQLHAYWFMPGPLGETVPRCSELSLAGGETTMRPGFLSRDLEMGDADSREWSRRNRLEGRFEHRHNFAAIFQPEDFRRSPAMAPSRDGRKFFPVAGDTNWQPNLLSGAAVAHAATAARRAFTADPARLSFSLSANDSVRFDDSPATRAAVSPLEFFRHRPNYSNLLFGFANAVAAQVSQQHPDRWLPMYAYYWGENAPTFPIARQVVPFLTADRALWSHPDFAREDQALIQRWCRSGAEIVGVYDYFYGAPYLCPRPTLYAVQESIPFEYQAGVRAFYAEANPNWALDGPKLWLAAQLLWEPTRAPGELLDIYWREFWAEAADPMRHYFAICDEVWRRQPGPARWLRFYQDEDQAGIFSRERLSELRSQLTRAAQVARSDAVRARIGFVSRGLDVCEAFAEFGAARDRLSRLARSGADPAAVIQAWSGYGQARRAFVNGHGAVRREQPLALGPQDLEIYLRNQPDSRAALVLAETEGGRRQLRDSAYLPWVSLGVTARELMEIPGRGVELLRDPQWQSVGDRPIVNPVMLEWTDAESPWRGQGEPWEGRTVERHRQAGTSSKLRLAGCRTEGIGQWVPAVENAVYLAKVQVRAKSSPGTATFLIVSFLDAEHRHLGLGRVDRMPAGGAVEEAGLRVLARAPPGARFIGFGVRVLNQLDDDFAEFSEASLLRLDP